ncbi:MAG TPA: SRPBCC family protein [Steroidobacteraceae bacterium]|jgi:uncharacterized protein YndB with AHSA1/START domain
MTALLGALLPVLALAQSAWLEDPAIQKRLAAREIVVQVQPDAQHVSAAVIIRAPAGVVWRVITDCEEAPRFMPGMKACRRLDSAADGSWEDIEREYKYSWLMPAAHDVVRTEYHKPERIEFQRVSGDFKDQKGAWLLSASPDGTTTVLEYQFYVELGFWLPRSLIQRSLRNDLPAAMKAVRARAEGPAAGPAAP